MNLSYNDPQRAKERANAVDPERGKILFFLHVIENQLPNEFKEVQKIAQQIIDRYENLQHFYSVAGGW